MDIPFFIGIITNGRYVCNMCSDRGNGAMYGCRKCDYDLCHDCFVKGDDGDNNNIF